MLDKSYFFHKYIIFFIVLITLGACTAKTLVKSDFPAPLVEKLPISVTVNFSDEFTNYIYTESGKKRDKRSVDFGSAQVSMLTSVFNSMFELVNLDESSKADLKITPEILSFQYTIPKESKVNVYEVWLKYRIKITDQLDNEVGDWVVKGYGKTPTALLKSSVKAFDTATNVALRDVGAQLAIGFKRQPNIRDFLENGNNGS